MKLFAPAMVLMATFAATAMLFIGGAILVAGLVEIVSKPASTVLFLILLVGVIPLAWRMAVRITEPRSGDDAARLAAAERRIGTVSRR